jgi:hypothetical protein
MKQVYIEKFCTSDEGQMSMIGNHHWSVARLIELSKNLKPFKIPLNGLNLYKKYDITIREFVTHMQAVLDADLKYPIIIDEDGEIMDGRHRIMKALLMKKKIIKAVRFKENPSPCKISE